MGTSGRHEPDLDPGTTPRLGPADVVIVGAGPAGTAAATTLARAGRRVLVLDKATFPRDKICGDGLTTAALRELEAMGLDPSTVASWIDVHDVVLRSPRGRQVTLPLPQGDGRFAAVARRRDLDAALVDVARAAGATVEEGASVVGAHLAEDRVELEVAGMGAVTAPWVIAADGMWSPLRKALGLADPGYRGEWHAFRQYVADVSPEASAQLVVWFEADLLPGYAWSFPLAGGHANVGFGILRGGSYKVADMAGLWREILARPHIRAFLGEGAHPEGPHRAWPIPARVHDTALAAGRTLLVGDAAAAADPLTGEGIGQALATGRWAAEAIIADASDPDAVRRAYEARVAHELSVDHRLADRLAGVLRSPLGASGAIRAAGATDWTRRNFARWLFEDYPRALAVTPTRWKKGMLTGHGAYR